MAFKDSGNVGWFLGGMIGIAATLIIVSLSWEFFEKPLLKMGHEHTY